MMQVATDLFKSSPENVRAVCLIYFNLLFLNLCYSCEIQIGINLKLMKNNKITNQTKIKIFYFHKILEKKKKSDHGVKI